MAPTTAPPKTQPWLSHRPDINFVKSKDTLGIDYGFKKGETIAMPGSAGSFYAHGGWQVEKDTQATTPRRTTQKSQPWLAHRPDINFVKAGDALGIEYGFKKGETIAMPGSAGSFYAHGGWGVEMDTKGRGGS